MQMYVPDYANLVNPRRFLNGFQAVPLTRCAILGPFVLVPKWALLELRCVSVCSLPRAVGSVWHWLFWLVEEKCVSEVKNLPFKFLCSLDQDYNSYPGLNTKWPCYSFPQIFWKAKSEARENTGLSPVLLEPQINGIYMKVGFGLLHLSLIALSLAEYKYCMMPQSCTSQSAQRRIFPYWTRQIL